MLIINSFIFTNIPFIVQQIGTVHRLIQYCVCCSSLQYGFSGFIGPLLRFLKHVIMCMMELTAAIGHKKIFLKNLSRDLMKPMIRIVKKFNKHHVVLDRDDKHFM